MFNRRDFVMTALGCGCGGLVSSGPNTPSGRCIPRLPTGDSANLALANLPHGLVVVDEFGRLHVGDGGGGRLVSGAPGPYIEAVATVAEVSRARIPSDANLLMIAGYYAPGDGGGGLATSTPTGEEPWFTDASGRPWFMAEEARDVRMYGVRADGTDETAAFARAAAYPGVVVLPKLARPYVISGTIPVHAQLIARGEKATLDLTVDGDNSGLWLQSGGAIEARIRRAVNTRFTGSSAGTRNVAILVGPVDTSAEEWTDWRIDAEIEAVGEPVNVVTILGNAHRGRIDDLRVHGDFEHALMVHWGWTQRGASPRTAHPRNIAIENFEADGGGVSEVGAVLSGVHDLRIRRAAIRDTILGLVVQAGDVGGAYAQGESRGRVMSGLEIERLSTSALRAESLRVNGYGYPLETHGGERWLMVDHPGVGLRVGALDAQRGDGATPASAVRLRMARNCHVQNLTEFPGPDAGPVPLDSGALIEASVDCSVAGSTQCARGAVIASGKNIRVRLDAECPEAAPTNNHAGVFLSGRAASVTVAAAISAGATSATFSGLTDLVFPGMLFAHGGALFEFAEGHYYDTHTPPGPVALAIRPAPAAIPAGATAELLVGGYGVEAAGEYAGFWAALRGATSDARIPRDVTFQGVAERCAMYGVYSIGGVNLTVKNSAFDFNGWQPDQTEQANIRFDGVAGVTLQGNSYNSKGSPQVAFNAYIRSTSSAVVNTGNRHYPVNETRPAHGANHYQGGGNADRASAANWYHPSITNKGA